MDPITLIVSALACGRGGRGKGVAESAVKDAYAGLKSLIVKKFGDKAEVADALNGVESAGIRKPPGRAQGRVEIAGAAASPDPEVLAQAQTLLDLLRALPQGGTSYSASAGAGGVIAQGGGLAGGAGSTVVGRDLHGGIHIGGGGASPSSPAKPVAEREALHEELQAQKALLQALKRRLHLASGGEAARLDVQIKQAQDAIAELEGRLDDLGANS